MREHLGWRSILPLLGVGVVSGFFSGLFGIGGGLIVVPALVAVLKMDHRRAVGTSLLAIMPAVLVGVGSYAFEGSLNWVAALVLAVGAVIGAQVGAKLLMVLSRRAAQWIFVAFVVVLVVQLFLIVPDRSSEPSWDALHVVGLLVLGLVAGILSAILGIGGGGVVVPLLMVVFGLSDLAAKGTSLAMMIPGVVSGVIANLRRKNVDVAGGLSVGIASVVTSPLGVLVAHLIPSRAGSILFACFLLFVGFTMVREAIRPEHPRAEA